jgi:TPP-dependent 2-oxoacid decarboxylase
VSRFFQRISQFIKPNSVVLAETGVSSFAVPEIKMPKNTCYISQVFYGSIGYSLGATLGVLYAAPDRPVILFIGDGSFQVVCQELSSIIRLHQKLPKRSPSCTPIIFLLNNDGYTIERKICDGDFNNIQPWKYHELPQAFCAPKECSAEIKTEEDLDKALINFEKQLHLPVYFLEIYLQR